MKTKLMKNHYCDATSTGYWGTGDVVFTLVLEVNFAPVKAFVRMGCSKVTWYRCNESFYQMFAFRYISIALFYIEPLGLLVRIFQWARDAIKAVIIKGTG